MPEGVLNVVPGKGSVCGQRIVEHPDVAKVAFTGSTEVGRGIAEAAAATIKRVTLELGGKSRQRDLRRLRPGGRRLFRARCAVFGNAGQDCCARSRILVERSAMDEFMSALGEGRHLDQGRRPARRVHPDGAGDLRRPAGDRLLLSSTATPPVAFRGSAPDGPGYWFPPTVLAPVSNDDRPAREEIFGPVACVIPFEGEAEAVRIANDTIYGLSGSVWTRDGAKALRVARAIETGVVSINSNTSVRVSTPFGGFKQSGVGRELGPDALEAYSEVKNVYYATEEADAWTTRGEGLCDHRSSERDRRRDGAAVRRRGRTRRGR